MTGHSTPDIDQTCEWCLLCWFHHYMLYVNVMWQNYIDITHFQCIGPARMVPLPSNQIQTDSTPGTQKRLHRNRSLRSSWHQPHPNKIYFFLNTKWEIDHAWDKPLNGSNKKHVNLRVRYGHVLQKVKKENTPGKGLAQGCQPPQVHGSKGEGVDTLV